VVPISPGFHGRRLVWRHEGRLHATPLLAVLLVLAATDVAFAADSIPSIFAVTRDPAIVFAANAMALLGLPSLFMLVEGLRERLVDLDLGLAGVLVLTGAQMAADIYHPPVWATLLAIVSVLGIAAIASLRHPTLREEPC
jgi:tellurite resistance protein TerC